MTITTRNHSLLTRLFAPPTTLVAVVLSLIAFTGGGAASAQEPHTPPPITVYHSPDGVKPNPGAPPGCVATTGGGVGGWLVVIGDVNADSFTAGVEPNAGFFENILGDGTNVLAGRGDGLGFGNPWTLRSAVDTYRSNELNTVVVQDAPILESSLVGVDLLIFNQSTFDEPLIYTSGEVDVIRNFLTAGGTVLLIAELSANPPASPDPDYNNFNSFLAGLGSEIRYTGGRDPSQLPGLYQEGAPFTAGLTGDFEQHYYNTLSGGIPIVRSQIGDLEPTVAAEQVGGGSGGISCVISGGANDELTLWVDGGSQPSDPEFETVCRMDDLDGGRGDEICGMELTLQLSGVGYFKEFIPAMNTLVLAPCQDPFAASCVLPDTTTKLLRMNFVRGPSDPPVGQRLLGSLIVNSEGLDETKNTTISGFGTAAGAKLQVRNYAAGNAPEVIAVAVPEPGWALQLLSGALGLVGLCRLKRQR